ncbi:MAG: hypothetical protein H0W88_10590 [Parachlamydiaceae bacterium]|nr:hypothetical protein [Parachlamydiaceae bacterium]
MQTDNFIKQFNQQRQLIDNEPKTYLEKLTGWASEHPTEVKTTEKAGMLIGTSMAIASPFLAPTIGFVAIPIAIIGGVVAAISFLAHLALEIIAPPRHEMKTHAFKTAEYGVGKLYYQGDVPVLELQSDDSRQAGVAHGYLMGSYINKIFNRIKFITCFSVHFPEAKNVPKALEEIRETLPPEYIEELNGVVEGFNTWAKENSIWRKITMDDLLLMHLMPDSLHFKPTEANHYAGRLKLNRKYEPIQEEKGDRKLNPIGCSVVIDKDDGEGFTFGRNMDWMSLGLFGTYTLMINRKYKDKKLSTAEIGFPGFVGTLTGMNSKGLSLSMNVSIGRTRFITGMPAVFFNRYCLENSNNVTEVGEKVNLRPPLGSYHLSVADQNEAQAFHLFQREERNDSGLIEKKHVIRKWSPLNPLVVTNCCYKDNNVQYNHLHSSAERHQIINELFQGAIANPALERGKLVEASLALPHVNNSITAHTVVMKPNTRSIKVAFDNMFSASRPLHTLDTDRFFSDNSTAE